MKDARLCVQIINNGDKEGESKICITLSRPTVRQENHQFIRIKPTIMQQPSLTTGASTKSAIDKQTRDDQEKPLQDHDERSHEEEAEEQKSTAEKDADDFIHRRNQTVVTQRPFETDIDDLVHPPSDADENEDR
jgi:hypothetical protein